MKKITNSFVVAWIMITKLIHLDELLEKYNSIWKNLAIILKKNLIENPSTIKKILESNQKSYGMTLQIFMINKMPKVGSKKMKPITHKCF